MSKKILGDNLVWFKFKNQFCISFPLNFRNKFLNDVSVDMDRDMIIQFGIDRSEHRCIKKVISEIQPHKNCKRKKAKLKQNKPN